MTECTRCRRQYQDGVRFCPVDGFAAVPISDPNLGRQLLGQFQLVAACGRGATGTVYRALQSGMDRQVAVKLLRADLLQDPTVVKRFVREARAGARLCHPNIATVHLVGQTEDGVPYIVMEYIEGAPLSALILSEGMLSAARVLHVGEQIASALAEAHDKGIIHRDLKPENILLTERRGDRDVVKVVDFGIAKIVADHYNSDSQLSRIGTVFGTPHYIAPEQASGTDIDHRADLYSLGCILFQMATGRVPFEGTSGIQVLLRHLREEPESPRALAPHLPEPLAQLILDLLRKDRAERPQDGEAVLVRIRALREALRGMPQPPALTTAESAFERLAGPFLSAVPTEVTPPPAGARPPSGEPAAAAPQLPDRPTSGAAPGSITDRPTSGAAPGSMTERPASGAAPGSMTERPASGAAPSLEEWAEPAAAPAADAAEPDEAELRMMLPWWRRRAAVVLGGAVLMGLLVGTAFALRARGYDLGLGQAGQAATGIPGQPPVAATPPASPQPAAAPALPPTPAAAPAPAKKAAASPAGAKHHPAAEREPRDDELPEVHFPAHGPPQHIDPPARAQARGAATAQPAPAAPLAPQPPITAPAFVAPAAPSPRPAPPLVAPFPQPTPPAAAAPAPQQPPAAAPTQPTPQQPPTAQPTPQQPPAAAPPAQQPPPSEAQPLPKPPPPEEEDPSQDPYHMLR